MQEKINSKDITVVVQGAISEEYATICLKSIKKNLPDATIILSTWKNSNVSNLDYDILVENDDPGFVTRDCTPDGKPNNVNRQIVSTINGLKKVNTKYALKIRTDFVIKNCNFLGYFDKYNEFDENYRIFEKRVIVAMYGTRKPCAQNFNLPFHVADFTTFGLTKDLIKLYDIPLVTEEEFKWFIIHNEFMPDTFARNRYNAEQSIWINCLRKNGVDVKCEYSTHVNDEIAEQSDKYLVNNFYPAPFAKLGLKPLKIYLKSKNNIEKYTDYYTTKEFIDLYKKYSDSKIAVAKFDLSRFIINFSILVMKKKIPKCLKKIIRFIFGLNF